MKSLTPWLAAIALGSSAHAATLAINFDGLDNNQATNVTAEGPLGVDAANWNNYNGSTGSNQAATADNGDAFTISWENGGEWRIVGFLGTSTDSVLRGYLDDPNGGSLNPTVTINGLASLAQGAYTVSLYYSTDAATANFDAGTVNGAFADSIQAVNNPGTTLGNAGGFTGSSQVQIFNNVTGDLTIDIGDADRSNGRATLAAITVEYTAAPEPSSAALLGLAGVALILRRRK